MSDMRLVELVQGSPEWLAWRETRYTASQAPSVMGVNPWFPRNAYELYRLRTGQEEVKVTAAMIAGQDAEPRIRELVEAELGFTGRAICVERDVDGVPLAASLDWLSGDNSLIIDFKRPMKGSESEAWQKVESGHYDWQLLHQLACCPEAVKAAVAIYAHDLDQIKLTPYVIRDDPRLEQLIETWKLYHSYVERMEPPPSGEQTDEEWLALAGEYKRLSAEVSSIEDRLKSIKDWMSERAATSASIGLECSAFGGGVKVTKVSRKGNVNWQAKPIKEALAQAGVDPEKYRGKGSSYWMVTQN